MRGRKQIPTYMKIVNGNPGRRPLNDREPQVQNLSGAPSWLSESARDEWRRMMDLLGGQVLKETDRAALAGYCAVYARFAEAEQHIAEEGSVVGLAPSPWLTVANKCIEQLLKLMPPLGLTPSDRARLKVERKDDEDDEDKRMFG